MLDRLMTVRDVAKYLQYSEFQVRRLVAKGDIPSIRIGGTNRQIRVVPSDLDKWIQSKSKPKEE